MVDGHNVLSNHRFDNARESNISKKAYIRDLHQRNDNDKNNNDKKDDVSPSLSFAQLEGKCYCCGKTGHKSPQCHHKSNTKREDLAINKIQMAHVKKSADNSESSVNERASEENNTTQEQHIGWAGVHVSFLQEHKYDLKKLILLNSDSNATVFCEKDYVTKIWDTGKHMV